MPHLSPLSWMMAPIMFFSILILLHSAMWWIFTPKMPLMNSALSINIFKPWNW